MAHVYERIVYCCLAYCGAKINIFGGDIQKLGEDI
jgi:hypothetical protein